MSDSHYPHERPYPPGRLTEGGELYLPPANEEGSSPGGGLEDGTTTGTTGRIAFPGGEYPVDDEELPG